MAASDSPQPPALARAGIDRAAAERDDDGLLARLRADAATRVLVVHGDRAPVTAPGRLRFAAPAQVAEGRAPDDIEWAFLGRDADGAAVLLAAADPERPPPVNAADWGSLRAIGGELDAVGAGTFVEALSLARWLRDAPYCPACGARTRVHAAGWARSCPQCGREHFPRTDPAVIVAVTADDERLLLGSNALWAEQNRFSTFAGFVEAGESLESAVEREVHEEAGVQVDALQYRGSQAWPYPRSLMLGFRARAVDPDAARADGEEIVAVRWFTRAEIRASLAGESAILLPGKASIAHRLISDWCAEAS